MIDIVDRLRFDAVRCEAQLSKGVAANITEAADEIKRLRDALQEIADNPCIDPEGNSQMALRALGQRAG